MPVTFTTSELINWNRRIQIKLKNFGFPYGCLVFALVIWVSLPSNSSADEYIVLDGVGGAFRHYLRPEARQLASQGHRVIYRPWWRWRNAVRAANGPVNIVGFSMGGSRAALAARHLDVGQLELLDPYLLRRQPVYLPPNVPTIIYRPTCKSLIRTGPVVGSRLEIPIATRHVGLPRVFRNRNFRR